MTRPVISVIVPTYNRKHCVMDAVESVLAQDMHTISFEVIVSDDGSTDGTKELFKKPRIGVRYLYNPKNRGVNAARNAAIRCARGEYILLLDSDDVLASDAAHVLARARKRLCAINFFGTAQVDSGKRLYAIYAPGKISYRAWLEKQVIRGEFTPVFRRSVFGTLQFDEDRFCFEGFFWNRAVKRYGLVVFDTVLRLYSFAEENRVSKKLLRPEYAAKRFDDYTRYVQEFEHDYRSLKLEKEFSTVLRTRAVYGMLCGKKMAAIESLSQAIALHLSIDKLFLQVLFLLSPRAFRTVYSTVLRFVRA